MGNTYSYPTHLGLTPNELFLIIAADQISKQIGIDDMEYILLILSGLPILPTRAKPRGATKGTSLASVASRSLFRFELKRRMLPTFTFGSIKRMRWLLTHKLSTFVGRTIPGVGWVMMGHDVFQIVHHTVTQYNRIVLPEDQVFG